MKRTQKSPSSPGRASRRISRPRGRSSAAPPTEKWEEKRIGVRMMTCAEDLRYMVREEIKIVSRNAGPATGEAAGSC